MKTHLTCPCGEYITAIDENDLVDKTTMHLSDRHPDLNYTREEILFLAY